MQIKNKRTISKAALLIVLIFFANPNIRMVDILPDFVACFIAASILEYHSIRAPFFESARKSFMTLGAVSLIRIPVSIFITTIRSGNVDDYDIIILFSFVFCVIEGMLFYFAVRDLFAGLFYLGQRSEAASLISPFSISKAKKRLYTPEKLKGLTVFAFVIKMCGNSLPEMLLLTKTVDTGAHVQVVNTYALYPYALVLAFILVSWVSVTCIRRFYLYSKEIISEGKFFDAADSMIESNMQSTLNARVKFQCIKRIALLLIISPIFSFTVRLDNVSQINLMPYFMVGVLMIASYGMIVKIYKKSKATLILGIAFSLLSIINAFIEGHFLDTYGYSSLVSNQAAKSAYLPVIFSSILSFIFFVAFIIVFRGFLGSFIGSLNASSSLSISDTGGAVRLMNLWLISAVLHGIARVADTVFRYYPDITVVAVGDQLSNVVTGLIPWFGTVLFCTSLAYLGASYLLFSSVKERASLLLE